MYTYMGHGTEPAVCAVSAEVHQASASPALAKIVFESKRDPNE